MFQTFQIDNLDDFPTQLETLLNQQRQKINEITQDAPATYDTVLKPLQDLDEELDLFFTPLSHLNSVMNSEATQKAYEASLPMLSKFGSEMAQNVPLYQKIASLNAEGKERQKVLENDIRNFKLSGIDLEESKKKRLEEINLELSNLSNSFSQNLLDATNAFELIIEDPKDVEGMPASDIEAAKTEIDGKHVYRFTLQMPSYLAYMTYGSNRAYRQELSKAYSTRAPQNAEVIDRILALKQEKAKLLGFENYAAYALQTRDASSQEEVLFFLNTLADAALPQAKEELEALKAFAKETDNIDDLQSHDVAYYSEKLKKSLFDFDDTMTKPYFQQSRVLGGLLKIVSELFGVTFKKTDVLTWHPCVKAYDIYEEGKLSGRIYFDLEARKEKRGGAWMHNWETHFVDTKGKTHLASAFVVCNFAPATEHTPSLLRHDDVVTLFHEMGHAIHHLFGKCKERSVSGINAVAWDVVEFPSQFLENFAYEAAILKRFGFHYESGEPISQTLMEKIKATKNFQAALGILRQVEFSLFDFMLHQKLYQGDEVQKLLDSIREKTALLKPPSYNRFQHGFAHIFAGGYAAGYYSYKWAEVLSADAFFACLDEKDGFDKEKAQGYKHYILSNGGAEEMSELYREWLGRKPQIESLLKLYEIV
ncbi:Oligopeptidase A [hydrothermal vent metagenome]|uniref:oligopeptidase A n=1 Tax=hydrothermal vent metagenome TaxID=652676 RepID=A0A1W1E7B2_9ZZZZ